MGGNFRTAIISTDLSTPSGLSLDYDERMLYWTDSSQYVQPFFKKKKQTKTKPTSDIFFNSFLTCFQR